VGGLAAALALLGSVVVLAAFATGASPVLLGWVAETYFAILPLFMVVSTISPHPGGDSPATTMARRLGLDPSNVSSLQSAVAPPSSARASIGVLGVILALLTATSFARALQRSYELAWRLPPAGGLQAAWRALVLVISLALYVELLFLFGHMVRGVPASTVLEDLATFAGAWALWTGAGWILLAGRVRPRLIAIGGLLTAFGFATCATYPRCTCPTW
jgi:membrane protein